MVEATNPPLIISKRKAINSLIPYAIFLEQNGQQVMVDAIFRAARASNSAKFMWHHIMRYTSRLFETRSPSSLNRVILLVSPHAPWRDTLNNAIAVSRWARAASTIAYTEEVCQSIIEALFQISYIDILRPHIPIEMWGWVKRHPSLASTYKGKLKEVNPRTIAYVHRLGDIEILKSYLLLTWTQDGALHSNTLHELESLIRKEFSGIEMEHHRKDLIEQLDRVLGRFDRRAVVQYRGLKDLLLELDVQ